MFACVRDSPSTFASTGGTLGGIQYGAFRNGRFHAPTTPQYPAEAEETREKRAPKRAVSDAALRSAKPAEKPYKIAAGGGLYLELMPGGSKLWRWKYRIGGKENRYAMGSYPDLSEVVKNSSGCCAPLQNSR
ncbi:Arm DNA-binding domain-containing protein [Azotobacter armeniacus]